MLVRDRGDRLASERLGDHPQCCIVVQREQTLPLPLLKLYNNIVMKGAVVFHDYDIGISEISLNPDYGHILCKSSVNADYLVMLDIEILYG